MSALPPPNDADIESRAAKMYAVWCESRDEGADWQTVDPDLADAWRSIAKLELERE